MNVNFFDIYIYLAYLNTGIYFSSMKIDINLLSKVIKTMAHVKVNEIISKNNFY